MDDQSPQERHIYSGFLSLPRELRDAILRHIAISRLDCAFCPATWRPVSVDEHIYKIGYFAKDAVIPIMLACQQLHEEVASILYGENTFTFHISGLISGPIAFVEQLSPLYAQLIAKAYVRTGYLAADQGLSYSVPAGIVDSTQSAEQKAIARRREIAISTALVKEAWPARYNVHVDIERCEVLEISDSATTIKDTRQIQCGRWPYTVGHLWRMVVEQPTTGEAQKVFRRIRWQYQDPEPLGTIAEQ